MNDGHMRTGDRVADIERLREEASLEARKGKNHQGSDAFGSPERIENLGRGAMQTLEKDKPEGVYGVYGYEAGGYAGAYTKLEDQSGSTGSSEREPFSSGQNGLNPQIIASGSPAQNNARNEIGWNMAGPSSENRPAFETILPAKGRKAGFGASRRARRRVSGQLAEADMETVLEAVQTTDDKGLNKAGYEVIRRLEKKLDETGDVAEFFEGCRALMAKNLRNSYANRRDFLKNLDGAS